MNSKLLKRLLEKGRETYRDILQNECYTTLEFSKLTGIVPQWLKVKADDYATYLYLEGEGEEELYWPKFQVSASGCAIKDFDAVTALLKVKGHSPFSVYTFWTTGPVGSDEPNIERLKKGHLREVLQDARTFYEHGGR